MRVRRQRRRAAALVGLLAGLAGFPGVARGHGVGGSRFDAPVPLELLLVGAAATVALTAVWLGRAGHRDPGAGRRHLCSVPAAVAGPLRAGLRWGFLGAVVAALAAGVAGPQVAAENAATAFTWPVWFRGVALLAVLAGSPWPALSPWRTLYRGLVRVEGRRLAVLGEYPAALGAWPAVAGFVVLFGVVETLTVVPRSPRLTAAVVATYGLVTLVGAVLFGPAWLRRADPLAVFYRLLGRVAPLEVTEDGGGGYRVALRAPWRECLAPVGGLSVAAFVVAAVYTVSFDGFTATRSFQALQFGVRGALGTGPATGVLLYVVGLGAFLVTFALGVLLGERLGTGTVRGWRAGTRAFAPTSLPIAAAYEVAHNYPWVLRNLGEVPARFARPVLHLPAPDPLWWLSLPGFWASQVVLVVLGHVAAVAAAHTVSVRRYGAGRALRGHLGLVALMVGYTVLSLWLVSRPVVTG